MATTSDAGALRASEALLCSIGGFQVTLRLPGQAAGSDAEQLGLGTPVFQEVPVGPAVWRKLGSDASLLIGASAIANLLGSGEFASAESLFQQAVGVVSSGVLYVIKKAEPLVAAGAPCAYRLTLEPPAWS